MKEQEQTQNHPCDNMHDDVIKSTFMTHEELEDYDRWVLKKVNSGSKNIETIEPQ